MKILCFSLQNQLKLGPDVTHRNIRLRLLSHMKEEVTMPVTSVAGWGGGFVIPHRQKWNRYRRPAGSVRSGPGPNFVPAGLPVDRSRPADRRPIDLSFFSYFFI